MLYWCQHGCRVAAGCKYHFCLSLPVCCYLGCRCCLLLLLLLLTLGGCGGDLDGSPDDERMGLGERQTAQRRGHADMAASC